jgi:hypothetical protein
MREELVRIEKTYRIRTVRNGKVVESAPVMAATAKDAMKLLGARSMSNLQVLENGIWVWLV